jgi:hypothetical protein
MYYFSRILYIEKQYTELKWGLGILPNLVGRDSNLQPSTLQTCAHLHTSEKCWALRAEEARMQSLLPHKSQDTASALK